MKIRHAWTLFLALVLVGVSPCPCACETVGRGDFELFLDTAVFRSADGGAVQEVYVRVRNSGLHFNKSGSVFESRINFSVTITDLAGQPVVDDKEDITFHEDDETKATSPLQFHTVIKRYPLDEGEYTLSCRIDDLNASKVSMMGIVKGSFRSAAVDDYPLSVMDFPGLGLSQSDAKFLWDVDSSMQEPVYQPNPPRLYGLYRDSLRVYLESYVPADLAESADLRLAMEILDSNGEVVREAAIPLPRRTAHRGGSLVTYPIVIQEDLNQLTAGTYTLYVNVGMSDTLLVRTRAGSFSVAWDLRTWEVTRRDYLIEARFLLSDRDVDEFEELSLGEQEKVIEEMWKKEDPDSTTGVNETRQKFLTRLEYTRAYFSDYQTGIFSDRGLIYLKFGPPDERDVDVMPQNRETMSDAFQKMEDKFHPINYRTSGTRMRCARPGQHIDPRQLSRVGEGGNVAFPFEVWVYNDGGDPILKRDQGLEQDIGRRFIFVDTDGYGRYKLESSSSMLNK